MAGLNALAAAAGSEPPTQNFGYVHEYGFFDSIVYVLAAPGTWAFMAIAVLIAALAAALLRKFVRRMGAFTVIALAGVAPVMILLGFFVVAGLFRRENGLDGLLDILLETQMFIALWLLFISGLLGARVTVAILSHRTKRSDGEAFE